MALAAIKEHSGVDATGSTPKPLTRLSRRGTATGNLWALENASEVVDGHYSVIMAPPSVRNTTDIPFCCGREEPARILAMSLQPE